MGTRSHQHYFHHVPSHRRPHLLLKVLARMAPNDVMLYVDDGCTLLTDPTPYLELAAAHGVVAFAGGLPMRVWTKAAVFSAMRLDIHDYGGMTPVRAGILAFQNRPWVSDLLREWEHWMTVDGGRWVTDENTSRLVVNSPDFREHRHDQALLSLLVYKHVFTLPTPAFYGPGADVIRVLHRGHTKKQKPTISVKQGRRRRKRGQKRGVRGPGH